MRRYSGSTLYEQMFASFQKLRTSFDLKYQIWKHEEKVKFCIEAVVDSSQYVVGTNVLIE